MATRRPAMFIGSDGSYRHDPTGPLRRAGARGDIGLWAWGRGHYPGEALRQNDLPGLLNVGLWEVEADQDWGLDWHLNEGIEVTYTTRGRVVLSTEHEQHELQRGWVSVTRPWQWHRLGNPNVTACTLGWFVLDVSALRPNQDWSWPGWLPMTESDVGLLTERLRGHDRCVWPASPELMHALDRMEDTVRSRHRHPLPRLAIAVSEVLVNLMDVLESDGLDVDPYYSSTQRAVEVFLGSLRNRMDEPWDIERMAAACGLGRTRFVHYCRQAVNASPLDYLNGLRADRALELLLRTDRTVADIAYSCGFSSSQYFATVFKHQFNRTPSEARRLAPGVSDSTR